MMKLVSAVALASLVAFVGCKKEEAAAPAPTEAAKPAEAPVEAAKPAEAVPAAAPAEAAPAAAAAETTGIAECDEYVATAAKFAACEKLSADAKGAAAKALETAKAGWAPLKDAAAPAAAKTAAADACKASTESLKKDWTAAGCM